MKLIFLVFVFIAAHFAETVYAEISEMEWIAEQAKLINSRANWKLVYRDAESIMEVYYDEKNIFEPSKDSKIVLLKKSYNNQHAITELIKVREQNMLSSGLGGPMKYDGFAFTIEMTKLFCSQTKIQIGCGDIAYDFDKYGNVLNVFSPNKAYIRILSDTFEEILYNKLCPAGKIAPK